MGLREGLGASARLVELAVDSGLALPVDEGLEVPLDLVDLGIGEL